MKKRSLFIAIAVLTTMSSTPLLAGSSKSGQETFIDQFDKNSDGQVTKKEFKKARKATFKLTDEDGNKKVDESEYVQEYANRLDKRAEDERKAHVIQTHTRFGSLDKNEDQRVEWAEYKASGDYSFKRYDTNDDKTIDAQDKKPENRWEKTPNGVKSEAAEAKNADKKTKWTAEKRKEMRKKYAKRVIHMPTTHNKKGMLAKYDTNENGEISYNEFDNIRRTHFDKVDEDGNGWLNKDEYLLEYTNRLDIQIESMRKKQIKQARVRFGVLDKNDDASMTFKEYQLSGMKRFNRKDTNEDGVISSDDPNPKHDHHHRHEAKKDCNDKDKAKGSKHNS